MKCQLSSHFKDKKRVFNQIKSSKSNQMFIFKDLTENIPLSENIFM